MQNRKPHRQKAPQTGHSIFGTILFSLLAVLAVEILLLTFAAHATRLGPQLNQNAEDILASHIYHCLSFDVDCLRVCFVLNLSS